MLYPHAVKRLLPENQTQADLVATQVILHTAVDAPGPSSLYPYFSRSDVGAETHFFVKLDGSVEQYMDTGVRANGNRWADVRAISIETEDEGKPDELPWTPAQLDSIKRLLEWVWQWHKVPRRVCRSWDDPGVGYHSMWGAPSEWTSYAGKTCPGPLRITQFRTVLRPWIEVPVAGKSTQGEVLDVIVRNQENGACLHVSGGVSILIDNTEDLADFKAAGIPVIDVRASQFRKYEKIRVDNR